jgi:hypothetical protein
MVDRPARIRYYAGNELTYTSPEQPPPAAAPGLRFVWLDPEGPHAVENIDEHRTEPSVSSSSRLSTPPDDAAGRSSNATTSEVLHPPHSHDLPQKIGHITIRDGCVLLPHGASLA